ncbi:(conserved with many other fungi) [Blumeria hordei DH14]|uniref:(Conserved with many other fungi) n=1 Tax=Blumeria graminis f. sp. hordei (strain DH14) TaxID=546991 RepID=N1JIZ6_BLUG1|nr:(conserved with many other fungi) [Blumeria hordei DH14]
MTEEQAEIYVNTHAEYAMRYWETFNIKDFELWEKFGERFDEWTEEIFKHMNDNLLENFRDFLRSRGVWVKKQRGFSRAKALCNLLQEEKPTEWSNEEINLMMTAGNFNSAHNPMFKQPQFIPDSKPKLPLTIPTPGNKFYADQDKQIESSQSVPKIPINQTVTRALIDLGKFYHDEEIKYGGGYYNILDVSLSEEFYHEAFSTILKGGARLFYYNVFLRAGLTTNFSIMIAQFKEHFETPQFQQAYLKEWREITFQGIREKNLDRSVQDCLQILFDKLQLLQQALGGTYVMDETIKQQLIIACKGVRGTQLMHFSPAATYEGVCSQLRAALNTEQPENPVGQYPAIATEQYIDYNQAPEYLYDEQYYFDRTYRGQNNGRRNFRGRGGGSRAQGIHSQYRNGMGSSERGTNSRGNFNNDSRRGYHERNYKKVCWICGKEGCFSSKHSNDEKQSGWNRYRNQQHFFQQDSYPNLSDYGHFLIHYEGMDGLPSSDMTTPDDLGQYLAGFSIEDTEEGNHDNYLTEIGTVDAIKTVFLLNNQSTRHALTKQDIFHEPRKENDVFLSVDRYNSGIFQGIIPDTGASGISTAGIPQLLALQKLDPTIKLDISTKGKHNIKFGKGSAETVGSAVVKTPLSPIIFHVVAANTPFLFCLKDMDDMGVKYDNLENVLVQGSKKVPVVRKWGHPFMMTYNMEETAAFCHLTETELRQLHRRFGQPSVRRLSEILERAGHEVDSVIIKRLTAFCHQCQTNSKSPGQFKFTLKDEHNFNYVIYVDIMYLEGKAVLQVVDSATSFQAARFLTDQTANGLWNCLRYCWIDVYQGPPDNIITDAGTNTSSSLIRQNAGLMGTEVKVVPVEAHHSIGKVEQYHIPLRRAYQILRDELKNDVISKEMILQMAVKAINDSAGPNGLVPTLLVFGAYPRMTSFDPPSPSIVQRAEAVRKAMKEVRRTIAERQIKDALGMRNGPNTLPILKLPIGSEVLVHREKKGEGWMGPYTLMSMEGETCRIMMPGGPTNFRSTSVKPYKREPAEHPTNDHDVNPDNIVQDVVDIPYNPPMTNPTLPAHQGRSPESSCADYLKAPRKSARLQNRLQYVNLVDFEQLDDEPDNGNFISHKEQADLVLAQKLREEGKIATPGEPFEASDKLEIDGLNASGVFEYVQYEPEGAHKGIRLFKSRLVHEVKGKATNMPYEKSRLVIQAFNDHGKSAILTQSPTIQQSAQRIIQALAPSLMLLQDQDIHIWLRNISQAYTQSTSCLNRIIIATLPAEIALQYPERTIMVVRKPLYGIPEAGTHWWATYSTHHKKELEMQSSTYDPCLFVSTNKDEFGVVAMQTDDTLIVCGPKFAAKGDERLRKAGFKAKEKEKLIVGKAIDFNGCILSIANNNVLIRQKKQGEKLSLIDLKDENYAQVYVEQRARGAYIATICQPEAAFDLSEATQHKQPTITEAAILNKRLDWQIKNQNRGLDYIPVDLATAKIFVFVDGSFANNQDYSSQIGYVIMISNEVSRENEFEITGNIIHWSSTKSKRVTRSVLSSELYGMVAGMDMAYSINSTITMILKQLELSALPIIVCTDSYSLYECLVKLGTTKEKRLMIDIMALRQSYERREMQEIRWINGNDNPADAMTKSICNTALKKFMDSNKLNIRVEGWVKR